MTRKETVAAAESCTAGLASHYIACIPGASEVFWGSCVTYTASAKTVMLGVPEDLINKCGAVSRNVALAMAEGALKKSGASWAFSVTGLAGPLGDGSKTPVGTVWIGIARRSFSRSKGSESSGTGLKGTECVKTSAVKYTFSGPRNDVREAATAAAFRELLKKL